MMALPDQLALTLVAAVAIVGSIAIWATVIARSSRGEELVPLEPRRPVPWTFFDLVLVMMAHVLFTGLGGVLLRDVWNIPLPAGLRELEPEQVGPVQLSYMAAVVATLVFALALVRLRVGATAADLGFMPRRVLYDVALGATGFLALAAPVYALQATLVYFFPIQHPLIDLVQAQPDQWTFLAVGLSVSLVAPLSEEFFLRVLLQGWLERVVAVAAPGAFGPNPHEAAEETAKRESAAGETQPTDNPYAAPQTTRLRSDFSVDDRAARAIPIVTSALVFALLHVGQGPAPIPLFLLALGLGYLYQRTHRLWPSVVLHFLLNTSSLAMLWLETG
jgi:membrane protease YdiL (CAAX protease family)